MWDPDPRLRKRVISPSSLCGGLDAGIGRPQEVHVVGPLRGGASIGCVPYVVAHREQGAVEADPRRGHAEEHCGEFTAGGVVDLNVQDQMGRHLDDRDGPDDRVGRISAARARLAKLSQVARGVRHRGVRIPHIRVTVGSGSHISGIRHRDPGARPRGRISHGRYSPSASDPDTAPAPLPSQDGLPKPGLATEDYRLETATDPGPAWEIPICGILTPGCPSQWRPTQQIARDPPAQLNTATAASGVLDALPVQPRSATCWSAHLDRPSLPPDDGLG